MGAMDWDETFPSPAEFMGAPDFPDVHREWVRREWVSGSQGLVNQHSPSGRMGLPRLFDYGGLNQCMLLPNVPHAICGDSNIEKEPPAPPPEPLAEPVGKKKAAEAFGVGMGVLLGATVLMAML